MLNKQVIGRGRVHKFTAHEEGFTFGDAIGCLVRKDEAFLRVFLRVLRGCPFLTFFIEFPAVSGRTVSVRRFEFVLVDAQALCGTIPDVDAFSQHFRRSPVASFLSLSGDAFLFVPVPRSRRGDLSAYTSIAPFVRQRSMRRQVVDVFSCAAKKLLQSLRIDPSRDFWLSTSGLGVPWVHVRIDIAPKYYTYTPYKKRSTV